MFVQQKKYQEALAAYEEAFTREPDSVVALAEIVKTEIALGDKEGAEQRLKTVLADNPEHRLAHDLLGLVYMEQGKLAEAEQEFVRQIEINPKSSVVYRQLATIRNRQGDVKGAINALEQGLEALPGNAGLLVGLAGIYTNSGELDKAATVYEQAAAADPDNPRFGLGLAGVRERQERFEDAIAVYERVIEKEPENLVALNNLAVLLSEKREDEQSLQRAKGLALKLAGSDQPALLDTLGWIHYRAGEYDEAAEILSGVVEQEPNVPIFRYHLGMTYYRQGDMRAAVTVLEKAVADEHAYEGVEEARKVYAEISAKQE
jgi:tetratricopeptide (TPR) repeat protein